MKKFILSVICLLPLSVLAQNGYTIEGKVGTLNTPAKVYLTYRAGTEQVTDSSVIANGAFRFTGKVESPVTATIRIKHDDTPDDPSKKAALDALSFYIENTKIFMTSADSVKHAKITGSWVNYDNALLKARLKPYTVQMDALNAEYSKASPEKRKDESFMGPLRARAEAIGEEMTRIYKDFAFKNLNNYMGLVAFRNYIGYEINAAVVEPEFNRFSPGVRNTTLGKTIASALESTKKTQIGAMAMDFTQNDTADKPVKLSDFRGKYVLLDFWASWCGPCRAENPNVVAAYNKYKDRNFTVLGVSLDQPGKKDAWLKAIEDDKLTWTQVSDLKFWNNEVARQYGIQSIPASFLIDPAGKIVGKNLRGEELIKKLEELLGAGASK